MRAIYAVFVLLGLSANANAGDKVGDWTTFNADGASYASTQSESGGRFGIICTPDAGCQYFVNILLECDDGVRTAFLLAGEAGNLATYAECVHFEKTAILAFEENLDNLVFASGNVGIAAATSDGKFKVMRFSMKGAIPAIAKAKEHIEKAKNPSDDGYSDTVL